MPIIGGGGGGSAFNGGTITGPLVIDPAAAGAVPLTLDAREQTGDVLDITVDSNVLGSVLAVNDVTSGNTIVNFDAMGDFKLQSGSGSAVLTVEAQSSADKITIDTTNGYTLRVANVLRFKALASGALFTAPPAPATVQLVTATGTRISTANDERTFTPITFNPGAATTATCLVEISPDNITYTALWTETEPAGVALDGTIHCIQVYVPANWYLRLTVNAQAVLGLTTYY